MTINLNVFSNIRAIDLIFKAYKLCGFNHEQLVIEDIQQAITSINILMTAWAKYNNLYAYQPYMYNLIGGQSTYQLPFGSANVPEEEVSVAQITRQLGGTAFSSAGGVAANAFNGIGTSACTQTSPNGYISYQFTSPQAINYIGVQSNTTQNYTLTLDYSFNGTNWFTSVFTQSQTYIAGQQVWFVNQVPQSALYFRINETGGATLNIQQIYFSIPYQSRVLSPMTRSEYISIPRKNISSWSTSYELVRSENPYLILWPTPNTSMLTQYPYLILNIKTIQPLIVEPTDLITIPNRFYEALYYGLAFRCALEIAPDKAQMLNAFYIEAMNDIEEEDTEGIPMRFYFSI